MVVSFWVRMADAIDVFDMKQEYAVPCILDWLNSKPENQISSQLKKKGRDLVSSWLNIRLSFYRVLHSPEKIIFVTFTLKQEVFIDAQRLKHEHVGTRLNTALKCQSMDCSPKPFQAFIKAGLTFVLVRELWHWWRSWVPSRPYDHPTTGASHCHDFGLSAFWSVAMDTYGARIIVKSAWTCDCRQGWM